MANVFNLNDFGEVVSDVLARVPYLVRNKAYSEEQKIEETKNLFDVTHVALFEGNVLGAEFRKSRMIESGVMSGGKLGNIQAVISLYIPKFYNFMKETGSGSDFDVPLDGLKKFIYNDAQVYGVFMHEVMHLVQSVFGDREGYREYQDYKKRQLMDIRKKEDKYEYTELPDEKGSNLEAIYFLKKKGYTLEDVKQKFFQNELRLAFREMGIYFEHRDEFRGKNNAVIKEKVIKKISELQALKETGLNCWQGNPWQKFRTFDAPNDYDENKYRDLRRDISGELSKLSFSQVIDKLKKLIMEYVDTKEVLYQFYKKYWDSVKMERKEVPQSVWGSVLCDKLIKIANGLEVLGLFKEASEVDRMDLML